MTLASSIASDTKTRTLTNAAGTPYLDSDDKELLACLRAGEDACYEELVRRFGSQVLATAKRYLRSDADAADCFQDTFLAVFESVDKFEQRSTIGTWIRGVTVNQCLMRVRARGRRREECIEHLLPVFDESGSRVDSFTGNQSSIVADSIDAARVREIVRGEINKLPDTYRVILLLRDIDGYSTKESALILGISMNAAKTRLHRARSTLKSMLEPEMERLNYYADM